MRSVNASFSASVALDQVRIAELYEIETADGNTYRYTHHSRDITWNSNLYTSLPIVRGPIQYNTNLQADTVQVFLANISGDFYDLVQKNVLDAVKITIKRICWDDDYAADRELILFVGTGDPDFDRQLLTLNCRSILNSLNIQVPRRLYQEPCGYALFDANCGLTQASYAYTGVATGGTTMTVVDTTRDTVYKGAFDDTTGTIAIGDTITGGINGYTAEVVNIVYDTATTGRLWYVELSNAANFEDDEVVANGGDNVTLNGVPAADPTFYALGEIEITSGNNNGCRRPILKDVGSTITVMWAFPNAIIATDAYKIYPGCDKRAVTCEERFGNEDEFGGFLYIPKAEEVIM